jgi:hypothetical protein
MRKYVPIVPLIQLRPSYCNKFQSCNAPICPLDSARLDRAHLKGEAICFYLSEAQKSGARDRFRGCIEGEIYRAICEVEEHLKFAYAPLRKGLERASRTPSRWGDFS